VTKSKSNRGALRTYKSYLFIDKDPVIDAIRTAISDSGLSYVQLRAKSSVSTSTISNWLHGKTKRPLWCTVWAVARACGKRGLTAGRDGTPRFHD
jgi:hypothetical protein